MKQWSMKVLMIAVIAAPSLASAQQILTRAHLQSILTSASTEGFENFVVGNGLSTPWTPNPLDASTGPVVAGIRFSSSGNLQMDGPNYFGRPSNTLLGVGGPFVVSFLNFTQAFGMDGSDFNCGLPCVWPNTVSVYGPGNSLLGVMTFAGAASPATEFIGWQNSGGIDYVELSLNPGNWTTGIDNVEFGTTVVATPEPASLLLLATGLLGIGIVRRRRNG